MTPEELKEFLKDENNKELFDSIAKENGYEPQDSILGLKDKNSQLLGKMKKLKESLTEKEKLLDNIDLDSYNEYIESGKKDSKGDSSRELARLKKELEENRKLVESLKGVNSEHDDLLKEIALQRSFEKFGIDTKFKKLLTSALKGKAKVEIDDDKKNVVIDEDGLGLSPDDYIKKWIETDEGKACLAQPDNKGGGNSAFNSSGSGKKITEDQFNQMNPKQKAKFMEDGGELI